MLKEYMEKKKYDTGVYTEKFIEEDKDVVPFLKKLSDQYYQLMKKNQENPDKAIFEITNHFLKC